MSWPIRRTLPGTRPTAIRAFPGLSPWILSVALLAPAAWAQDENWWDGFPSTNAPNARVHSLAVLDNTLYCGGQFTTVAGLSAGYVAAWDGAQWDSLAGGADGQVEAVASYAGQLIAAGSINLIGGVSVNHVAAWNGVSWTALGAGVPNYGTCVVEFQGDLVVGEASGQIWRWNGVSWSVMGSGLGGVPRCLTVYSGVLYLGGDFSGHVRYWDGSAWQILGGGITGSTVFSMTEHLGSLVVGGDFTAAGPTPASHVAAWDGATWSALGAGVSHRVFDLASYQTELIAVGEFTSAGGSPASRIARWNGSSWSALGSGLAGLGFSAQAFQGALYAGGSFPQAGGKDSYFIARWQGIADCNENGIVDSLDIANATSLDVNGNGVPDECETVGVESGDDGSSQGRTLVMTPNPVRTEARIRYSIAAAEVVTLSIHDITGARVLRLDLGLVPAGSREAVWDGRDAAGRPVPDGVYFVRLESPSHRETVKVLKLRR